MLELRDGPLAHLSFSERRTEVLKDGYAIREKFADPIRVPLGVQIAFNQLGYIETTVLKQLEVFMLQTFTGE